MAGAPRTASRRMASATCSGERQARQTSSAGSRVWSSSSNEPSCQRRGEKSGASLMALDLTPRPAGRPHTALVRSSAPHRGAHDESPGGTGGTVKGTPRDLGFSTRAIHAGQPPDPRTGAVAVPIYQTSTYVQLSLGEHQGYEYARVQNPTREALEQNLAQLEGGVSGHAFASGMAAIASLMTLVKAGEHVVVSRNVYGGTYRYFTQVLERYQVSFSWVDSSSL